MLLLDSVSSTAESFGRLAESADMPPLPPILILIIAFISFMQMLLGVFLVKFYHITTLGFSDDWFVTTPYILTGLGASVIFISILGGFF